jgi:hypothetical protein
MEARTTLGGSKAEADRFEGDRAGVRVADARGRLRRGVSGHRSGRKPTLSAAAVAAAGPGAHGSTVLNCQHHVSWVVEVAGGLHQCILCTRVVGKKDVYPKLEDLPAEFQRRWDDWEARQQEPAPGSAAPEPPDHVPAPETDATSPRPRGPELRGVSPPPTPPAQPGLGV